MPSKCLNPDHNSKETCRPSCVWKDDKCSPGRRSGSPRKPSLWNRTVSDVAKQYREKGLKVAGPDLFREASTRYRTQAPVEVRQKLERGFVAKEQRKERKALNKEFQRRPQAGGDHDASQYWQSSE